MKHLEVEVILPRGERKFFNLDIGDVVAMSNPGDPDPVVTVSRIGKKQVQVKLRSEDERLTARDLELLAQERMSYDS